MSFQKLDVFVIYGDRDLFVFFHHDIGVAVVIYVYTEHYRLVICDAFDLVKWFEHREQTLFASLVVRNDSDLLECEHSSVLVDQRDRFFIVGI